MTLTEFENEIFASDPEYLANLGGVGLGKLAPFLESAVLSMQKRDWISVGVRGQSVACLRGASASNIGNGSSNYKIAPSIGTPAARALQSIGLAKASRRPVLCLLGNAALGDGQLFEALNLVALQKVPVIFVVLERDTSTMPLAQSCAVSIDVIAQTLGIAATVVTSHQALSEAVAAAREESIPTLIRVTID
jgi:TPP-dependent pyruvate/acetoin dehydrogenase alpha subunit